MLTLTSAETSFLSLNPCKISVYLQIHLNEINKSINKPINNSAKTRCVIAGYVIWRLSDKMRTKWRKVSQNVKVNKDKMYPLTSETWILKYMYYWCKNILWMWTKQKLENKIFSECTNKSTKWKWCQNTNALKLSKKFKGFFLCVSTSADLNPLQFWKTNIHVINNMLSLGD